MAVKKETPERKATGKKLAKGDSYACEVCGLSLVVDEVCDCVDVCDIICCGEPMKERRIKVKATKG